MANSERLKLSAEPDGFGFFYGWAERNGERVRVDVLPPARVERREDLPAVLGITGPTRSLAGLLARLRALQRQ